MYCMTVYIDVLRIAQYLIWYCERVVTVCVFLDANSSLTTMGDPWPRTSRGPVGNDSMEACTTRRLTPACARDCVHNSGPQGSLSPSGEQQHESAPEEVQTSLERELVRTVKSAPRTVKPDLETTDPRKRHFSAACRTIDDTWVPLLSDLLSILDSCGAVLLS